jgi:transposase InsO family protein
MKAEFGVEFLTGRFGVTVSGYYEWAKRPAISPRKAAQWDLSAKVLGLFVASGGVSGHRKIHAELAAAGVIVDKKTVAARMRELHLVPKQTVRAWKRAAARKRVTPDPADLVERNFSTDVAPGTVLVGDITYVHTDEGWLYTATVIDLGSRTVLGSASSKRIDTTLIIRALKNAIDTGHVAENAIFHTDHGVQYRSRRFRTYCKRHHIRQSMGSNFECWDNAVAESFFSKLKGERLDWCHFATRAAAAAEVADYIRHFNHHRRHQTLGYATPIATLERLTQPATTLPAAA